MNRRDLLRRFGLFGAIAVIDPAKLIDQLAPDRPHGPIGGAHVRIRPNTDPFIEDLTAAFEHDITKPLVASGGLCAPISPYYNLTVRPVLNDALPHFTTSRGDVHFDAPAL